MCGLTPCRLPALPALVWNEDWDAAMSVTEAALLQCAAQVIDCINIQEAATRAAAR